MFTQWERVENVCIWTDLKYNEALKPLSWLFGKWRSEQGMGKYPTIQDFTYIEEAEFSPIGMQPNVEYK